ncbi:hypothetical protein [Patulibacter medicamentivorans]|uniref:hypothetical protein n=1 Tax=Patulibacter medicamentivorans TaxID=1097667 RepID=UPI0011109EFC|nr:hypothetical protein [Patulibacter medicamentivorans]
MKVQDPEGTTWRVRRRWLPWRRRVRDVPDMPVDIGGLGDDPISAVIGIFLLILAIPALIVITILLAELLILIALLPLFLVLRAVAPVPWTIEVRRRWKLEREEQVRGWGASRARIQDIASELRLRAPQKPDAAEPAADAV